MQAENMNGKHPDLNIAGFFIIDEISRGIVDAIAGLLAKIREERRAIDCQVERKRKMQNELRREAIARLPPELDYRSWARR